MNILIQGGRLIDPANNVDQVTDIYVANGLIASIGTAPEGFEADTVIHAASQVVAPGFVDLCAHTREPGFSMKGSIASETHAAVAGGVTTLVTPPTTQPIIDTTAVAELVHDRAEEAGKAKVLPMGALTKGLEGAQLAPMHTLKSAGCVAFTNARLPVDNSLVMLRCLEYAATHDLLVVFQPQDTALAAGGHMHDDINATRLGLNGIPEAAETVEVARCLLLAESAGVRAHFAQLSSAKSTQMVIDARERGLKVTADVAIHNLLLTDENVNGFNSNFYVIPPLRSPLDRAGLRSALLSDGIQAICSDHQPHEAAAKAAPFAATEPGITGLETLLPLSMLLVEQGVLSLPQLIEKLTSGPASILGIEAGSLSVGATADLCIFDPEAQWQLTPETSLSKGKNSPFMNYPLKGKVSHTLVNGQVVYSA